MYIAFNAYLGEQESFFQQEHEIAQREQKQYADHTVPGNHTMQERYSSIAAAAWDKICLIRDVRKKFQDMSLLSEKEDVRTFGDRVIVLPEQKRLNTGAHGLTPFSIVEVLMVGDKMIKARTEEGKIIHLYFEEIQEMPTTEPLDQE